MATRTDDDQLAVRTIAVAHHHDAAGQFVRWYEDLAHDRFANAFAYGRYKIDVLLDETLKTLPAGARVLDVGCGTGEYVHRVNELGFRASGLEPAESMRDAARARNPGSDIIDGLATDLPYPDESFDLVICIEVVRYLHRADVRLALREMRRVLRPSGRLFLTAVNKYALDGFYLFHRMQTMVSGHSAKVPHCEFMTPADIDQELREAGFSTAVHRGVLLGPMRILYKLSTRLARGISRTLEPIDDAICAIPATTPLAGHLVTIATR
jgi:ubiquinone/menaquinone biosynthesis C-methylase UbiE